MKKVLLLLFMFAIIALCCCACGYYESSVEEDDTDYSEDIEAEEEHHEVLDVYNLPFEEVKEGMYGWDVYNEWIEMHDYLDSFEWEEVESDAIQEVGYSEYLGNLAIRFNGYPNTVYVYEDVPEEVFYEMIFADSVGGYYNSYIKGYYDSERIDE